MRHYKTLLILFIITVFSLAACNKKNTASVSNAEETLAVEDSEKSVEEILKDSAIEPTNGTLFSTEEADTIRYDILSSIENCNRSAGNCYLVLDYITDQYVILGSTDTAMREYAANYIRAFSDEQRAAFRETLDSLNSYSKDLFNSSQSDAYKIIGSSPKDRIYGLENVKELLEAITRGLEDGSSQ